jgi:hypothetical protein
MPMQKSAGSLVGAMLLLAVLASGCASFPGKQLPTVDALPDTAGLRSKPAVYIDAKVFTDLSGGKRPRTENKAATERFQKVVEKVTQESGLFSRYTLDPAKAADMDYTVKMEMLNHGDAASAAVSGFITGLTLFVVPGAATDNYTLTSTITDRRGKQLSTQALDDSVKTWTGIWFVPLMAKSPATVVPQVWENMIRNLYQKMYETKVLPYAALRPERMVAAISIAAAVSAF